IEPALKELHLGLTDIDCIINTHAHPDHLGGNGAIKRASKALVMLHTADEPFTTGPDGYLSSKYDISAVMRKIGREDQVDARRQVLSRHLGEIVGVDRWLQDGDRIDLGRGMVLQVLHTPGHTAGSISLYWEKEAMLLTGDSLQGRGIFPGWMPFYFHAAEYIQSAARLSQLPLQTLCLGHGYQTGGRINHPVRQGKEAVKSVEESLEVAQMIDAAVSAALESEPSSDLVGFTRAVLTQLQYDLPVILDRNLGAPPHSLAAVNAHLEMKQESIS
ncbi:unnamed protein product, partial [marine sediment metagenome]